MAADDLPPDDPRVSAHAGLADAALVDAMRGGSRAAFAEIFRRYHRQVHRFVWQMTGTNDTADDVTQDVFMALATGRSAYVASQGALGTYLYGIARHLVAQRRRRWRLRSEVTLEALAPGEVPAAPENHDERLTQEARIASVRRAILRLPAHYREVLVLCELHGCSYEDTATVIGCPVGTVRSRLNRARWLLADRCRAALGEEAGPGACLRTATGVTR